MISFDYLYDYYPESIIEVTDEQMRIRELIKGFMSGDMDQELLYAVVARVKELAKSDGIDIVCFIPGSTGAKTILRFGELAVLLDRELDCDVFLDTITLKFDSNLITYTQFYQCNKERVGGKNVLLIGGVYTTGQTLQEVGDLLKHNGANSIYGLFIAKTI